MDFTFDDQQTDFHEAVRKFLVVEAAPEMLREIWETQSGRSAELRAKLADQGLTALSVPEAHDGMGLGELDWVLVLQELGYHAIPDSLFDTAYLAVYILNSLPNGHKHKAEWLPKIAHGGVRLAVGHPINPLVADAENSSLLLLWHNDEVHAVKPAQAHLSANTSIDMSRRLYRVEWTPNDISRVCNAEQGKALWQGVLDRASLAIAAQQLGLAQRMLDLGIDYAAQRKQFGKAIGSFQAIKHHLADVAVKIEFTKPVIHRAAYAIERGHANASLYVSHARLAASEAARLAARKSIQAHGAMGYTWEADLQMFAKRAWALDASWGDHAYHKARVAKHVLAADAVLGPAETFN
jgi:alkylation response protein AidB-like acyl-CoA dehydrogenase